jgi:NAD(P)-dependent dehydrogenase (short-subunit alcohol dehydrogenase family)
MVTKCIATFGKIDILVNNAAITGPTNVLPFEVSDQDWQRVLAINLFGTYWCCKAVEKTSRQD